MMDKGKDKMFKPEAGKQKVAPPPAPKAAPLVVVCVSECNVPEVGTWKAGDQIKDPAVIAKVLGSPNFKKIEEVE